MRVKQDFRQWRRVRANYPVVRGLGASDGRRKALLDYIVEPFLNDFSPELARSHANYWRAVVIVESLQELGFSVDVTDWRNVHAPPARHYDLVIGQARAFRASCRGCRKNIPRIFMGAALHVDAAISELAARVSSLQKRRNIELREEHPAWWDGSPWATDIFYIGNDFIGNSYRQATGIPCFEIGTAAQECVAITLNDKNFVEARSHFLWMAAYGPLKRGLDVLLEVFETLPNHHLWICGDLENSERHFFRAFRRELLELPNIHYLGWVDVAGEAFRQVTQQCAHMVYPSVNDGMPGSVVNSMAAGLIPMVTQGAGVDTGGLGIQIPTLDHQVIQKLLQTASTTDPHDLASRAEQVAEFARVRYSRQAFRENFRKCLRQVLERHTN